MKKLVYLFVIPAFMMSCGGSESHENDTDSDSTEVITETVDTTSEEETPKPLKSPRMSASGMANSVQVDIDYGSPYVKGREIWGELVAYDKIWRAGANEATAITFGADVMIGDSEVAAGTYALFITPKADADWTVILNEEWSKELHGVWGAYDHKPEKDVAQIDVTPSFGDEVVESLTFSLTETGVMFQWEKASFTLDVMAK
jgi:hypothetical protein